MTKQVARTGFDKIMRPATYALAKQLGPKLNRQLARGISNKILSGAAANSHLAKLLRGNVTTAILTTAVFSAADVYRLCTGSISGRQAFKNVATKAAGVIGGAGGWMAGAAVSAAAGSAIPVIGTAAAGIVGGFLGGFGAGGLAVWGSKAAMDKLIDDDAKQMTGILEEVMAESANAYLLSQSEIHRFRELITSNDLHNLLRAIYKADDRRSFCRMKCDEILDIMVKQRKPVCLPSPKIMSEALWASS